MTHDGTHYYGDDCPGGHIVEGIPKLPETAHSADYVRHPVTGRFLAHDCEIDCLQHCAGLCGNMAIDGTKQQFDGPGGDDA